MSIEHFPAFQEFYYSDSSIVWLPMFSPLSSISILLYSYMRLNPLLDGIVILHENIFAGVISGALLYIRDEFVAVNKSSFLQVLVLAYA